MATVSATEASLGIAAPQVRQKRLPAGMRLAHDGHCIRAFALLFGILSHGASALLVKRECDPRLSRAPDRAAL
jgi:hypothetical protein